METFPTKHSSLITASLSCFDRLIFKGYLPLGYENAIENLFSRQGQLFKQFDRFAKAQSALLKDHAERTAQEAGRPFENLNAWQAKEAVVDRILKENPVSEGLICILAAVEMGGSFRVASGEGCPRLLRAPRKCRCLYGATAR